MSGNPLVPLPDWYDPDFDAYCIEVGRLTALWAALERSVDELIWELMDVPAYHGMCVTAQMIGPGPRLRALLALMQVWQTDDDLAGKFRQFGKLFTELGSKRNRYAHDTVGRGQQTGTLLKTEITADKVLRYKIKSEDVNGIRLLWIEIRWARQTLAGLRAELVEQLPSWTRTRFEQSRATAPAGIPDRD